SCYNLAPMTTQSDNKQRAQFWVGMIISAACLAAIFLLIEPREIWEALQTAHYGYLGLSALGVVAFLLLRAVRWAFMLRNQVPWRQVFHIQNVGYLLTFILPFRLGDVARAVLIGNVPPVTLPQGISTMVVERILDLLFIVVLLPFTLTALRTVPEAVQSAGLIAGLLAVGGIALLVIAANKPYTAHRLARAVLSRLSFMNTERWLHRLDELLVGLVSLTRWRDALVLAVLSILIWSPIVLAYYSSMLAVNLDASLAMAGFVVCAAALSITAPSSPGQVGVFHAGVTFALVQILRQPDGASASFAFLYHALNFLVVVVLGLIGVYSINNTLGNVISAAQNVMNRNRENVPT
ncbi:MAG: lysylphosphatidylglycerol synthase transmembrane domain-containing protein, partial [bacterium]